MVSGLITLALLLLFVGGWIWAWSPRRKRVFEEAAQLPLDDGEGGATATPDAARDTTGATADGGDDAGDDTGDDTGNGGRQ